MNIRLSDLPAKTLSDWLAILSGCERVIKYNADGSIDVSWITITNSEEYYDAAPSWIQMKIRY